MIRERSGFFSDSLKIKFIVTRFINEISAENANGAINLLPRSIECNSPDMIGPAIAPNAIATYMKEMFLAFFLSSDKSLTAATATAVFPPVPPSISLAIKARGRFWVYIATKKRSLEKNVPNIVILSMIFLPCLSDNCPSRGAMKN